VLKTLTSELVDAGYSGLNSACQSAYGFANVTTACRSSSPCSTEAISSYPVVEETLYSVFVPFSACHWAVMSATVIGVPSDQTASGLIVYVTTCGSSEVSSIEVK
jgi:hypothetical protein